MLKLYLIFTLVYKQLNNLSYEHRCERTHLFDLIIHAFLRINLGRLQGKALLNATLRWLFTGF
jgi:hypothetical protein